MKKVFMMMCFVFLALTLVVSYADAITGVCSNCHTMHNSQGGEPEDGDGPNERLLRAGCVACHSGESGQKNATTNAPIVNHTAAVTGQGGSSTNAGGDFYWVANGSDIKGHSVEGIVAIDATNTPPGFDQAATATLSFDDKTLQVTGGAGWGSEQLTCAGTFGCHGTRDGRDFAGLKGAHHNNTGGTATVATNPTTVGNSYRFLAGIKGLENSNWNWGETDSAHNEYYGVNAPTNRQYDSGSTYVNTDTASFLCAECHGSFHTDIANNADGGSPWRRHPTDIALPSEGEYAGYDTYSVEAPVARPSVYTESSATVTPGTDVVMCLSCHRAHGSPEDYLLRWTYDDMQAGGSNSGGCFTCHTDKNAPTP